MNSYFWVSLTDLVQVFVAMGFTVQTVEIAINLDSDMLGDTHNNFPRRDVLQYKAPLINFFHALGRGRCVATTLGAGFEHGYPLQNSSYLTTATPLPMTKV